MTSSHSGDLSSISTNRDYSDYCGYDDSDIKLELLFTRPMVSPNDDLSHASDFYPESAVRGLCLGAA